MSEKEGNRWCDYVSEAEKDTRFYDRHGKPYVWCLSAPDERGNRTTLNHEGGERAIRVVPEAALSAVEAEREEIRAEKERDRIQHQEQRLKDVGDRDRLDRLGAILEKERDGFEDRMLDEQQALEDQRERAERAEAALSAVEAERDALENMLRLSEQHMQYWQERAERAEAALSEAEREAKEDAEAFRARIASYAEDLSEALDLLAAMEDWLGVPDYTRHSDCESARKALGDAKVFLRAHGRLDA